MFDGLANLSFLI